ncbi:MAG: glycosyltransferase, partial [Pseudomonadales bacterium]
GFPDTFKKRKGTFFTGNPVRQDIVALLKTPPSNAAPAKELSSCRILIIGGSRGARALNEQMPALIQRLSSEAKGSVEVWHQTGDAERNATQNRYEQLGVEARVDAFIDVMAESYQWTDLVVCRAGAMTVAELTLAACASVLVPFPFAIDDHQTENGRWLERNHAALLIPQTNLSTEESYSSLLQLVNNSESRESMAAAAAELSVIDSAQQVYQHCCQLARCEASA